MDNEKPTTESLENKIFILEKELFEFKLKLNELNSETSEKKLEPERIILDKILDISPIGISYVDASGNVVYANKRSEEIFRLPKIKLLEIESKSAAWQATTLDGKPFPDDELPFVRVKNTKMPVLNVVHCIEYQEQKKIISVSAAPLLNDINDFKGMIAIVEDITARKLAEETFRRSEESYRTLVENIPDYIMRYDRQHRHIFANSRTYRSNNLTAGEFLGKTHQELGFDPRLCEIWEKAMDKIFETGEPQVEVFEWEDANGLKANLEWRAYPEYVQDGSIETLIAISRDITERKQAEEEILKQLEELHRWYEVTLDREGRVLELKQEVNELLKQSGESVKYESTLNNSPNSSN